MGAPQNFLLDSLKLKNIVLGNKGSFSTTTNNNSSNLISSTSLWTEKLRQTKKKQMHLRKNRRVVLMKRRRSSMIRRRDENGIRSKVQTLKSLIPNRESDQGLDGLFRDTASYIMSLQMRVRVMQIMVDVLDTTQAHDE